MNRLTDFPDVYRKSIRKVSKKLKTDYVSAYRMLLLEALLYDMNPTDSEVADLVIQEHTCG